jgi:hypothetical protein
MSPDTQRRHPDEGIKRSGPGDTGCPAGRARRVIHRHQRGRPPRDRARYSRSRDGAAAGGTGKPTRLAGCGAAPRRAAWQLRRGARPARADHGRRSDSCRAPQRWRRRDLPARRRSQESVPAQRCAEGAVRAQRCGRPAVLVQRCDWCGRCDTRAEQPGRCHALAANRRPQPAHKRGTGREQPGPDHRSGARTEIARGQRGHCGRATQFGASGRSFGWLGLCHATKRAGRSGRSDAGGACQR